MWYRMYLASKIKDITMGKVKYSDKGIKGDLNRHQHGMPVGERIPGGKLNAQL